MGEYPKYEKVNEKTIKITVEKTNDIPIEIILTNKETLLLQKQQIEKQLKDIQSVIDNAKRLGIDVYLTPKDITSNKEKK